MAVMKFGGTSIGTAKAMRQAISIVAHQEQESTPLVVLSACSGITNKLLRIADASGNGSLDDALALAGEVRAHHLGLVDELLTDEGPKAELALKIDAIITRLELLVKGVEIVGELTERSRDMFCSFGELLSTTVFAAALQAAGINARWIDIRTIMITDDNFGFARPIEAECRARATAILGPLLGSGTTVVTQGYIGATADGRTTTLGRGGSDLSAALLGAWLHFSAIQIWTDVDGVMTCDPRVVPDARSIRVMTFSEAAELAYLGAKVLHPDTIAPAVEKNIPVFVLNTWHPDARGTVITNDPVRLSGMSYGGLVKSIAVKKGQGIINVRSNRMLGRHGFMNELFDVFARYAISVEMIATSEVSVSVTVDDTCFTDNLLRDLREFGEVDIEHGVATVSVVGDNLRMSRGVAGRIFGALTEVNLRMISQGASEINVGFVVGEHDVVAAVNALHREFFSGEDAAGIFEVPAGKPLT
ncbi:MAG: lysine-sensitive aspartokinase 3 [Candidatus Chlorobium antarcticum]|nr:lysine-sensitive aspartokinase 3 [Candidatus Chlorobium antarcticum]